eukprot:2368382-Rhodomonas_salina.2
MYLVSYPAPRVGCAWSDVRVEADTRTLMVIGCVGADESMGGVWTRTAVSHAPSKMYRHTSRRVSRGSHRIYALACRSVLQTNKRRARA